MPIIPNGYRNVFTIPIEDIRKQAAEAARKDIQAIVIEFPEFLVGADFIIRRFEMNLEEIKQANAGVDLSEEVIEGLGEAGNAFRQGYRMQMGRMMRPVGMNPVDRALDEDPAPVPFCFTCGMPTVSTGGVCGKCSR